MGALPSGCDEKSLLKLERCGAAAARAAGLQAADADDCGGRAAYYRLQRAHHASETGEPLGDARLEDRRAIREAVRAGLREAIRRRANVSFTAGPREVTAAFSAIAAPEEGLASAVKAAAIRAAFESLAPADQSLLSAHHDDGLSLELIAQALECTVDAVKQWLVRARGRLEGALRRAGVEVRRR